MYSKLLSAVFLMCQLFTFGQSNWEQMANTPFTKDHGIGFSGNGFGYVLTGGANGQVFTATRDFFRYDPSNDTWTQLADYPGPPRGYGIGDVWDGKLYFGFGTNGFILLDDLWEYDISSGVFTQLPSCPCSGRVHPALIATNGKVYVGAGGASGNLNDWWTYDIASQQWSQRTSIPQTRHHPYQFSINGDIYVGSGHRSTWYKFTESTNNWTPIAPLFAVRVAGAQFNYGGKGYALSGADNNHTSFNTGEFWEYDPLTDNWTSLEPHPGRSRFGPTQFLIDDYIYIAGGYDRNDALGRMDPLSTMYRFNLNPSTAAVEETEEAVTLSIFPNPSNDIINLKLSVEASNNTLVTIYNMGGQLVSSLPFSQVIDIAELEAGLYIVNVENEDGVIARERISKY